MRTLSQLDFDVWYQFRQFNIYTYIDAYTHFKINIESMYDLKHIDADNLYRQFFMSQISVLHCK